MRFDLPDFLRLHHSDALAAVFVRPAAEFGQARQLLLVRGNDQLAAEAVGDLLLVAIPDQFGPAGDAEAGLERARLVVDAGVDDAAVVAGLVLPDLRLLLQHHQARAGT